MLLIVFSVAVLVRWSGVFLYPNMLPAPDTIYEYDPIAVNVASGNGFVLNNGEPDSIRGPGYPLFLAAIYKTLGRNYIAVRLIQSVLDGVTVVFVVHMTWILWGNWKRAIIAGSLLSLYPFSVYSSNLVAVETLFCLVFFMSVFFFIKGCRKESLGMFIVSGILLAYSVLIRSTSLLFPLAMGVWLFVFKGISKKNLAGCACLLFAFAAVILPWSIRNYNVFNEFIVTSTNGGINFYLGSSLKYLRPREERMQQAKIEDELRIMADMGIRSPQKGDLYFRKLGWQNYKNAWFHNPLDVAKLVFYKAIRFWYATDSGRQEKVLFVIQIAFLLVSIFGVLNAITRKQCPAETWLLVMSVFYYWLIFIVMFPLARYTMPIVPMLAILTSLNFNKSSISAIPAFMSENKTRLDR
jgi:4-amino-4-deoxy-L-arabinose transferase-like glycosyltransferase